MAILENDLEWKRRIIGLSGPDLSLCYQCGTCTAVCPLSTAENPFPRKEMVWVQWGLRERALGNASIWLCHQCGTCTSYCPRDAKPSQVMAALRDDSVAHHAVPAFMGRALGRPAYLPLLFALPTAIVLVLLGWLGRLTALPPGPIVFSKLIPIAYVEAIFMASISLSLVGAAAGALRYWWAMSKAAGAAPGGRRLWTALAPTLAEILRHRRFRRCTEAPAGTRGTADVDGPRAHLVAFYGFLGLVVTTASVGVGIYAFGYLTPWPVWHPVKVLGNLSGAAILAAVSVFIARRLARRRLPGHSRYPDWLFLIVLGLTTLTGFGCQWLRLAELRLAYPMYALHLVLIYVLLVYVPYSKLAHVVYRTTAMLHEQATAAREPGRSESPPVAEASGQPTGAPSR